MIYFTRTFLLCYIYAFLFAGCAVETPMVPPPLIMAVDKNKVVQANGVNVTVEANAWDGNSKVTYDVTPMKLTIKNGYTSAIRIRYNDISLIGASDHVYAALPPYKIGGTIDNPIITEHSKIYSTPSFYYNKFRIAPYYSLIYPGIPSIEGLFTIDPLYHDRHYRYWEDISLPTKEMLELALLEGDIDPGGEISGYVYFERVSNEKAATFQMILMDAKSGNSIGTATIPFFVR